MRLVKADSNDANGTCLQGIFNASYKAVVKVFGEPHQLGSPDDKVKVEWVFKIRDGKDEVVFTIYDWKEYGRDVEDITEWHVGGSFDGGDSVMVKDFFSEKGFPLGTGF